MKTSNKILVHHCVSGKKAHRSLTIHENDEIAAQLDERVRKGHKGEFKARREKLAAVYFDVEEVYDQTPALESGGKLIT
jgi:hypothetical protein